MCVVEGLGIGYVVVFDISGRRNSLTKGMILYNATIWRSESSSVLLEFGCKESEVRDEVGEMWDALVYHIKDI